MAKRDDDVTMLRQALDQARAALESCPNPRVVDGAPAFWDWYDQARAAALDAATLTLEVV